MSFLQFLRIQTGNMISWQCPATVIKIISHSLMRLYALFKTDGERGRRKQEGEAGRGGGGGGRERGECMTRER